MVLIYMVVTQNTLRIHKGEKIRFETALDPIKCRKKVNFFVDRPLRAPRAWWSNFFSEFFCSFFFLVVRPLKKIFFLRLPLLLLQRLLLTCATMFWVTILYEYHGWSREALSTQAYKNIINYIEHGKSRTFTPRKLFSRML